MKEVNIFGIPMSVPNAEDIEAARQEGDTHIYWVSRVVDMDFNAVPLPLRERLRKRVFTTQCDVCKELCYVDPLAFNPFRELKLVITCTRCLAKEKGLPHP